MRVLCISTEKNNDFSNYFTKGKTYKIVKVGLSNINNNIQYTVIRNDGDINTLTEGSWLKHFNILQTFYVPKFYYKLFNVFKT